MNTNTRIQLNDTPISAITKLGDGNMGAMNVMMQMISSDHIDLAMGGMGVLLSLDTHGIYGTDIYVLHSDICGNDMVKTLAVLRAVQLGLFDEATLVDACSRQDYSGRDMVPVDELYAKVKERLPKFNAVELE